jgi:hypothetical protein
MNLLPRKQRKRVRLIIYFQNIVFSGFILILLFLIIIFCLGGFLIFLNFQYQAVEKEIEIEQSKIIQTETVRGIERKIRDINNEMFELKKIQTEQSNIYQALENIYQELFVGVRVYALEIDTKTKKVVVTGYSATREKLLAIKQVLETSDRYRDVEFPLSNLVGPISIDFRFSFIYEY